MNEEGRRRTVIGKGQDDSSDRCSFKTSKKPVFLLKKNAMEIAVSGGEA